MEKVVTTISTGYPINTSSGYQLKPNNLQTIEHVSPFDSSSLTVMNLEQRQQQLDLQNSQPQSVIIEDNGKIIASFGDNGWRHFQNGSDSDFRYTAMNDAQVIDALQKKYGGTLQVTTYPPGQGPTAGEVFEKIHGYAPPRLVDYTV